MSGGNGRGPDDGGEGPAGRGLLAELVLAVVDQLAGVDRIDDDDGAVWRRAGRPFAALASVALEVRLQAPVAHAALRTPDTAASKRGEGWVRFAPASLDRFAADRVAAWLESAWRHAVD